MIIQGTITSILPIEKGVGNNGKEWQNQSIIIETGGKYSKKVCLKLIDKDLIDKFNIGQVCDFEVNIESREYNGKWYTEVKPWRYTNIGDEAKAPAKGKTKDEKPIDLSQDTGNSLPF